VYITGIKTLYFGLAGCLLTVGYPWLKYHALGDLDIFLTYSVLPILGTSFVACGAIVPQLLWLTIPIGLITVGILHANNTRDTEHDNRANIKTFAMLVGKKASAWLYCFEVIFPFLWVVAAIIAGALPLWSLLVLVALKPAIDNARKAMAFLTEGMGALIGVDELTAKLQLMFSLLLTISLFVSALV
jgi:1,4-dihydroxy-2-naphthoate octaprenyltransferase